MRPLRLTLLALTLTALLAAPALAERILRQATSQKVYVPVYSHVYQGIKNRAYNLSALLSVRNVDLKEPITIVSVKYYDDHGNMVEDFVNTPTVVPAMATFEVHIPERDQKGGSGANFTVKWHSKNKVSIPVIQAVMIGTASTQGISFVCDGVVIEED